MIEGIKERLSSFVATRPLGALVLRMEAGTLSRPRDLAEDARVTDGDVPPELPAYSDDEADERDLARADALLSELPEYIRDPISRGREIPVVWSSSSDSPPATDLIGLSDKDFATYQQVVELRHRVEERRAARAVRGSGADDAR